MTISPIYTTSPTTTVPQEVAETFALLDALHIPFERVEHDPADTMEDCRAISEALCCQVCKNLFLTNRQQTEFYLLCLPADKVFKTKDLSHQIGTSRLSFGSPEKMRELLGVNPGSASILSLFHDKENKVRLLLDRELYTKQHISCHPCKSTGTLKLDTSDVLNIFLPHVHHTVTLVDLPSHEEG